jgi:hypothetical protein
MSIIIFFKIIVDIYKNLVYIVLYFIYFMIYSKYDYSYDSQEEMLAEIERQDKEQQQAYLRSLEIESSKPELSDLPF